MCHIERHCESSTGKDFSRDLHLTEYAVGSGKRQETDLRMRRSTSTICTCPSPTKEKMTSKPHQVTTRLLDQ